MVSFIHSVKILNILKEKTQKYMFPQCNYQNWPLEWARDHVVSRAHCYPRVLASTGGMCGYRGPTLCCFISYYSTRTNNVFLVSLVGAVITIMINASFIPPPRQLLLFALLSLQKWGLSWRCGIVQNQMDRAQTGVPVGRWSGPWCRQKRKWDRRECLALLLYSTDTSVSVSDSLVNPRFCFLINRPF